MPKIIFDGETIECGYGENLRKVLIRAGKPP
jgi:hypothetical protein